MAVSFTISYTFSPGTTISSSQVNTNFSDESNVWTGLEAKTTTISNLGVDTELKSGGTVKSANGTVAAPGITFTNSTGTGLYRIGADDLGIATAGVIALEITSTQAVRIKGTATNDSAAVSYVGEYIESIAGTTSFPSTGTWGDGTSITLTAGDWDVDTCIMTSRNGATVPTVELGISLTTGNSSTGLTQGTNWTRNTGPTATSDVSASVSNYRLSFASTTIVYMKVNSTFTVATPTFVGRLSARRRR